MAAAEFVDDLNDCRLKPRLLRSLVRDFLPDDADDKRPFRPADLSVVLDSIKTHGLLSEWLCPPADVKLAEAWRSAVDAWVERVLALASSGMPDKCWAGICLLGVTVEECSSDRLMSSYSPWFQRISQNIQTPSSTHFVNMASCASLSDLFTRLASHSNLKKDATSLAGRLIQPLLQLVNENGRVAEGALDLLCTLFKYYPFSVRRYYDDLESALASKIMNTTCCGQTLKKFASVLALLPHVRGDNDSWSLMMQKLLIAVSTILNDAFQGLEEESKGYEIMRLSVTPGRDLPPPLGGQSMLVEAPVHATRRLRESMVPIVSALTHCCCLMLTNPFPTQVPVPLRLLLTLVRRVLLVDGSLHKSPLPSTTSLNQELLCSALPSLHLDVLVLLMGIIKGMRSQLLPHAAEVVQIIGEYFQKAKLPSLRTKVYSVVQSLLISMGAGMAIYIVQIVLDNAFADLDASCGSSSLSNACSSVVTNGVSMKRSRRKRKHASTSQEQHLSGVDSGISAIGRAPATPLSLQIAALNAIETLLTVGGSLRSERWRSDVDLLLITVATNAFDSRWGCETRSFADVEPTESKADFLLVALQTLLASFMSRSYVPPPYLSQGLQLFHRGKLETGAEFAAFCSRALLALEVLIHPRALPLVDYSISKNSLSDEGFNSTCCTLTSLIDTVKEDEMHYYDWCGSSDEDQAADGTNNDLAAEKRARVDSPRADPGVQGGGEQPPITGIDEKMAPRGAEEERKEDNEVVVELSEPKSSNGDADAAGDWVHRDDMVQEEILASNRATDPSDDAIITQSSAAGGVEKDATTAIASALNLRTSLEDPVKNLDALRKGNAVDSDSDSLDSFPDIVDADPDSD